MAPTGPLQIINSYVLHGAPTGEGMRYVCADGSVWKDEPAPTFRAETGVQYGGIDGNRIYPQGRGG